MGRDVAAPTVARADIPRTHPLLTEKRVDQRRLPGAGRADQRDGHAIADACTQRLDTLGAQGARHMDRHAAAVALHCGDASGNVVADVGLVEDDCGLCPARPDAGEVALDPAHVEVGIEAAHRKHQVDVGRHHLGASLAARNASGESRASGQDALDGGRAFGTGWLADDDPVADPGRPGVFELGTQSSG